MLFEVKKIFEIRYAEIERVIFSFAILGGVFTCVYFCYVIVQGDNLNILRIIIVRMV